MKDVLVIIGITILALVSVTVVVPVIIYQLVCKTLLFRAGMQA